MSLSPIWVGRRANGSVGPLTLENAVLVPQWSGADTQLADRITTTDVYRGLLQLCLNSTMLRGTYGSGERLGWVVTSSTVTRERKGIAILTIKWEVGGPWADHRFLPLDDFRSESVELYPKAERNSGLAADDVATNPNHRISHQTVALAYSARDASYRAWSSSGIYSNQTLGALNNMDAWTSDPPSGSTWAEQKAWGLKLYRWLMRGHETYYEAGIKYSWIWYSFSFPTLSKGGIIEPFPIGGPMMGDASQSWLRLADVPEPAGVNGSVYKITSTWLGGPNGHWDWEVYPTSR